MTKRFQEKIAGSRFSLPATAFIVLAIWILGGISDKYTYLHLAIFTLSAYLMVELNNGNALIRVYSRMVSCSFLVLMTMASFMFTQTSVWTMQLCLIAAYITLLKSYQDKRAQGVVFYAFALIGVASTQFVQILFFVPILWLLMVVNLMSFSLRSMAASLIGLMSPYWFLAGFYAYNDNIASLADHFAAIARFAPLFQYDITDIRPVVTLAFITILVMTGAVHFLRNSYKDKIRTRMIYEMFISLSAATIVFIILQPQHAVQLTAILVVNASVLIGHFIALTRTRFTNIAFVAMLLVTIALTLYNMYGLAY